MSSHPTDNQSEGPTDSQSTPSVIHSVSTVPTAATDPVALAKIVDFCEELKRQNEEVKQQLVEQHSVLASLRSSLVAKAPPKNKDATRATATTKKSTAKERKFARGDVSANHRELSALAPAEEKARCSAQYDVKRGAPSSTASGTVAALRASVVRSRPLLRGESKIPLPSGVGRLGTEIASSDITHHAELKPEPKEKRRVHCRLSPKEESTPPLLRSATSAKEADRGALESVKVFRDLESPPEAIAEAKVVTDHQITSKCCGEKEEEASGDDIGGHSVSFVTLSRAAKRSVDGNDDNEDANGDAVELSLGGESEFVGCDDAVEEIAGSSTFVLAGDAESLLVSLDRLPHELFSQLQ